MLFQISFGAVQAPSSHGKNCKFVRQALLRDQSAEESVTKHVRLSYRFVGQINQEQVIFWMTCFPRMIAQVKNHQRHM